MDMLGLHREGEKWDSHIDDIDHRMVSISMCKSNSHTYIQKPLTAANEADSISLDIHDM